MNIPLPPRATESKWRNRNTEESISGAVVTAGSRRVFIPTNDIRRIADELHDIADQIETGALPEPIHTTRSTP